MGLLCHFEIKIVFLCILTFAFRFSDKSLPDRDWGTCSRGKTEKMRIRHDKRWISLFVLYYFCIIHYLLFLIPGGRSAKRGQPRANVDPRGIPL